MSDLANFFKPSSVAVVGASDKQGKIGHAIMKNMVSSGFKGKLYPINPKQTEIMGYKCYSSLKDLNKPVDLVVIAVPAQAVNAVATEAAQIGAKHLIVISAGFKEIGREGKEREKKLLNICRKTGMHMLGPNCVGMIDTHTPINASFANGFPNKGHIAFISQSGAMLVSILDWSMETGLGFSKFISMGNKGDLNEANFIEAAAEDDETKVILCYIEDVSFGKQFLEVAQRASQKKPVIILKSGASQAGAMAASSHTGALAGSDRAYEVAFKQSGVLRARTMEGLFDLAKSFAKHPLPKGDRIAVITNAGGPGIITTDWIEKEDLKMAEFEKETAQALRKGLPPEASIYNPVDVLGDALADRFDFALQTVLKDPNVDGVLLLLCPVATAQPEKTAEAAINAQKKFPDKPIFASYMGGKSLAKGTKILSDAGIPCYTFPERAVSAFKGMVSYSSFRRRLQKKAPLSFDNVDKNAVKATLYDAVKDGRMVLLSSEAASLVKAYGIPATPIKLAKTASQASKIAEEIGYPVVLKVASPKILHKTDVGGVQIGLNTAEEVETGFLEIMDRVQKHFPDTILYGVEIQKMMAKGKEFIVGMSKDLQFGPLLAFGMGGIYVNLLQDVSFRLAEGLTIEEIKEMIAETKAYSLLRGYRGDSPADINAVINIIGRLAQLCLDFPEITEVDLNPIFVYERGAAAVDVKVTISCD